MPKFVHFVYLIHKEGSKGVKKVGGEKKEMRRVATGLYVYESRTRRHQGKADVCYHAKIERKWHKIGWASEGITQAYAVRMRSEMALRLRHGEMAKVRAQTLEEAWEDYLKTAEGRRDLQSKLGKWKTWVKPQLGHLRIDRIGMLDLEKMRSAMEADGRAPATIRHMLTLIRHIYNVLEKIGKFSGKNPTKGMSFAIPDNRRERFLSAAEAAALLAELKRRRGDTYLLSLFSLRTGLRIGEIFKVRWKMVDFERKILKLPGDITKNRKDKKLPITDDLYSELQNRHDRMESASPNGLIFPPRTRKGQENVAGRTQTPSTFDAVVERLGFNEGVTELRDKVVFHTLRHTYCTWVGELSGESQLTTSKAMGHKDSRMTERYFHPDIERVRSAVEAAAIANPLLPAGPQPEQVEKG